MANNKRPFKEKFRENFKKNYQKNFNESFEKDFQKKFEESFGAYYQYNIGNKEKGLESLRETLFSNPEDRTARNFMNKIVQENSSMSEDPKVGVVVPAYVSKKNEKNAKKYLANSLDSLLLQDFDKPYNIYVVDDGSPVNVENFLKDMYGDSMNSVLDEKGNEKEKINEKGKVSVVKLDSPSGGPSRPRNVGYRMLKDSHKYLSHFDSDDIAEKNRLKDLYDHLEKNPKADAVHAKHYSIDENNSPLSKDSNDIDGWFRWCRRWVLGLPEKEKDTKNYVSHDQKVKDKLVRENKNYIHNATTMVRSDFLNKGISDKYYFPEPDHYGQDQEFWKKVNALGEMDYLDSTVARYRQHSNNRTNAKTK